MSAPQVMGSVHARLDRILTRMPTMSAAAPMLEGLGAIADRYDALFCDIWGVVHDGLRENGGAGDALERFRERGGTVVLVTNAPVPQSSVERLLAQKMVRRSAWDAIVSWETSPAP